MSNIPKIFIAYSRKDEELLAELRTHLTPLERSHRVELWFDGKIEPGVVWEKEIKDQLHQADIILLLVSADAIASDYFYEKEMKDALTRHKKGLARVVPLIIRPCSWKATPLGNLQALPKDGKAVTSWQDHDAAYNDAVNSLWQMIEDHETRVRKSTTPATKIPEATRNYSAVKQKETKAAKRPIKRPWLFMGLGALLLVIATLVIYNLFMKSGTEPIAKQAEQINAPFTNTNLNFNDLNLKAFVDNIEKNMVDIPGGTFNMGCNNPITENCHPNESPLHKVKIKGFKMGKFEVTQSEWRTIMQNNPAFHKNCDLCPMEMVSWNDVQGFLKRLNELTGKNYRLPSEAEWEYAAKAGTELLYAGSNNPDDVAWYDRTTSTPRPVGLKQPNLFGLYDMSGNVLEWCQDSYFENYIGAPNTQKAWEDSPSNPYRANRGGSWFTNDYYARVSRRNFFDLNFRVQNLGFRLAIDD